jgi:hypothetical protein
MCYRTVLALTALVSSLGACGSELGPSQEEILPGPGVGGPLFAATRTQFEGFIYGCDGTPPESERVTPGGVLHFLASTNLNLWVTGDPLIDGFALNTVDANINLKTGSGVAHVENVIRPDAVAGTWEIHTTVKIGEGGFGVGHGTGELAGMTIKFTVQPVSGPLENLCNPDHPSVMTVEGVIIAPREG